MAKLSKTKVKDFILDYAKKYIGLNVKTIESLDGYFIFDFGKNSVFHITFNEIPGWKFGIWLVWDDDNKKKLRVDFFGDKIHWINKFKPTQTPIANRVVIESYKDIEDRFGKLWDLFHYSCDGFDSTGDLERWLLSLKRHRHLTEYFINNDHAERSFLKFLLDEFWFYDVYKNLCDFYEKYMLPWHVHFTAFVWKWLFRKYLIIRDVHDTRKLYFMHPYDIYLEYRNGTTEEEMKKVYTFIEKKSILKKWCNLFSRHVGDVTVEHCEFGVKRGFYFPELENNNK